MKNYLKSFQNKDTAVQVVKLGLIGGFNTIVTLAFANLFKFGAGMRSEWAVSLAWVIGTLLSYVLNRTWTFSLSPAGASVKETSHFFVVNAAAWALTVGIVKVAEWWLGELDGWSFNAAQLLAAAIIVIPKFAAYRDVVFRRSLDKAGT
jgi:putative flippase GtrA